ncbi:MAG: hypothetical protein M3150_06515 [Pseudomonadota bacterium]|nr:hypothetical protein [Pseudomonadota bacterium]
MDKYWLKHDPGGVPHDVRPEQYAKIVDPTLTEENIVRHCRQRAPRCYHMSFQTVAGGSP